ncbi:DUF494 domain-containing protein [Marinicella sp. W31]|uniref:DUF494 domain-containing protein n=1 Tax=Marinicella sp. W31 TaxID=3023713 RepID=UPI003758253C
MNENIIDLLVYLFENYLYDNQEQIIKEELYQGLQQAGFSTLTIDRALGWLEHLQEDNSEPVTEIPVAVRIYAEEEYNKLDDEGINFIMYLENAGILDPSCRELLINSLLNLDTDNVDVDDLQWLVLIILYSRPDQHQAFALMESLMFDSPDDHEH